MKAAVFTINNHAEIEKVINYLNLNHAKAAVEGKPLIVTISTKQMDRSTAQNRLYWKWLTQFADHIGSTKEEQHTFFKMNEYLNQIEVFCLMHGAKLLIPCDLEWCYQA